jgi:VCBS repeat-containing protein
LIPALRPAGLTRVTVTATDTSAATDSATFTWTVSNPAPTAVDDGLAAGADDASAVVGNALGNDSDPDGDALTATVQSGIAGSNGGLFSIAANGDVTFDPNGDFDDLGAGGTRDTTLTYAISDGEGGTDTATITVTVSGINQAPVAGAIADQAGNDCRCRVAGCLGRFSDGDAGDTLTYSATGLPTGLSINAATGRDLGHD